MDFQSVNKRIDPTINCFQAVFPMDRIGVTFRHNIHGSPIKPCVGHQHSPGLVQAYQSERSGSDRINAKFRAVVIDRLARNNGRHSCGQGVSELRKRTFKPYSYRMLVQSLKADFCGQFAIHHRSGLQTSNSIAP